ncbi:MAG: hypothetical protein KF774_09340 [Planctomyces sp.]|nr:hypothetical protein [Planctomyces sp.]
MGKIKRARESFPQDDEPAGMPIGLVILASAAVIAFVLWGVACAMYASAEGVQYGTARRSAAAIGRGGIIVFVKNAIVFLPELPQVVGYIVRERFWFVIVSGAVLTGTALFGWQLKRMDQSMRSGNPFTKKVRRKSKR